MKQLARFILFIALTVILFKTHAQPVLYGMTTGGGDGAGSIFAMSTGSAGLSAQTNFTFFAGSEPLYTQLIQASNGKLYGLTGGGGYNGKGILFEFNPSTNTFKECYSFKLSGNDGGTPRGSLAQASNGKLYGMTTYGGTMNEGVLFQFDPSSSTYSKLLDFDNISKGRNPQGSLTEAGNGKLYGTTTSGGTNNVGVLFEYDPASSVYTKKLDFTSSTSGASPAGRLAVTANGKLYGMTTTGGANNLGVIFEYDATTNSYTKKIDFTGSSNGSKPAGSFTEHGGKLYATTGEGGMNNEGVIFEYDPATNICTKKFDMGGVTGIGPFCTLEYDPNGKFYGMTTAGGSNGKGVLFEFDPSTNAYAKKLDFDPRTNGATPYGSLMRATSGKFYGLTSWGGTNDNGVLFEYNISTNTYTKHLDFGAGNGASPFGSLIKAANGKLYGMTNLGGFYDLGVIFEYDPLTHNCTRHFDLGFYSGCSPVGSLLAASNGKFYGMTQCGGSSGGTGTGDLFEYDPGAKTYSVLIDCGIGSDGMFPSGSLIQGLNGKIYGLMNSGGALGFGLIFEYNLSTHTYTKKFDFDGSLNGGVPAGSLLQAANGKLYGMTVAGGTNSVGVLFEYDLSTNSYTTKHNFNGAVSGSHPYGTPVQASNGKLYGMTTEGGSNDLGVLFEYDPATNVFSKKLDFNGTANGSHPYGDLIEAANGKLYGMTTNGGVKDSGTVFEYDPIANLHTKKLDLTTATGVNPGWGRLIEVILQDVSVTSLTSIGVEMFVAYPNPNNGFFEIKTAKQGALSIYNSIGQLVATQELHNGENEIHLNGVAEGMYFLRLEGKDGSYSSRIIKQ